MPSKPKSKKSSPNFRTDPFGSARPSDSHWFFRGLQDGHGNVFRHYRVVNSFHFVMLDQPEKFSQAVQDFLDADRPEKSSPP